MKFRGHETFAIRKNWISKGLKKSVQNPDLFFNKDRNPMDILGVGSNMVKSLRYWMTAINLLEEVKEGRGRIHRLTPLGNLIWKYDRYTEEWGTLWLMHYSLVKNYNNATAWYYFFNEFNLSEFSKEDFVGNITNYISIRESEVYSVKSLDDDFRCIINTYMPRYKTIPGKDSPEDNMECPLAELGLIDYQITGKTYKKINSNKDNIPALILLAVILDQADKRKEIPLADLLNAKCNAGRVFNLDIISLLGILAKLENSNLVQVVRTAGLDVVRINTDMTYYECIERYYESLA